MRLFPQLLAPMVALPLAFGCGGAGEEDSDGTAAHVRREKRCSAEVDVSMETFAFITADNSGVRCYDDSGAYVASIIGSMDGVTSDVRIFQGMKKTFPGKSGNFVKVRGVARTNESQECWVSTTYLCPATNSSGN